MKVFPSILIVNKIRVTGGVGPGVVGSEWMASILVNQHSMDLNLILIIGLIYIGEQIDVYNSFGKVVDLGVLLILR
jgi:hypothetical protein